MTDADEKIRYSLDTIYGDPVYCSRRTAAHLDDTRRRLSTKDGCSLYIMQGAYNTTVKASAGTHDFDAVLDVGINGMTWWRAQRFLRANGWAAWYRYPPTFGNHIHMISLGYTAEVGYLVPGQVEDYYAHRSGLAGHAADNTWHPDDIDATIFVYEVDDMPNMQELKTDLVPAIVKAMLLHDLDGEDGALTVARALRQASRADDVEALVKTLPAAVVAALPAKAVLSTEDVRKACENAVRNVLGSLR